MFKTYSMLLDLRSLELENFKCFKEKQSFEFGKLTILTGANSSGKSSILHAILVAAQSGGMPFRFSPNGKYTNMGDFKSISYGHKINNLIHLGLTFYAHGEKTEYHISTSWRRNKKDFLPELHNLCVKADYMSIQITYTNDKYHLTFNYDPQKDKSMNEEQKKLFFEKSLTTFQMGLKKDSKKKLNPEQELKDFKKFLDTLFIEVKDLGIKDIKSIDKIMDYVKKAGNARLQLIMDVIVPNITTNFDATFNLISSFRLHPSRTYLETSRDKSKVDKFGEGYLDQIMIWEKTRSTKYKELESVLKKLKLLTSLKPNRIEGGRYEVHLTPNENGVPTALPDVGFGISQFLPIIVADLQLPNESTLMIAEPEIHLHPSIQANFGDYLISQIKNKKKRYVIETHSEYLLNRIRLGIVKNRIEPEDVKIYFLENNGTDVITHNLIFSKDGSISNAPQSFFDTYFMDVKDIALNSFE